MGWLLSLVMAMPLGAGDIEMKMWFSKQSYCTFAIEKFSETPFIAHLDDGRKAPGAVKSAACRELGKDEQALVPEHLRWKVKPFGGLFDNN